MAKKKQETVEIKDQFIVEEESSTSSIYSFSARLVTPKISRKILIDNIKEEITISPLESGLGLTIGNSLRRCMLSHIGGYGIAAVKIKGCTHKFQNINGIRENVCDILMNLKEVIIKPSNNKHPAFYGTIEVKGPGDVTAKDIIMENGIICNPDHFICSLDVNGSFSAKLLICYGRGYVVAEQQKFQNSLSKEDDFLESSLILDTTYNHIKKVEYHVEPTRVDDKTDYDKLIFIIETSGAITPEEALGSSYQLLQNQIKIIETLPDSEIEIEEQEEVINDSNIPEYMFYSINKIGLPPRVQNTLALNNIKYVGDLVSKSESELIRLSRMGNESIQAIKQNLATSGLSLGMVIKGWRSNNIQENSEDIDNSSNNFHDDDTMLIEDNEE
jgi:DNA-directed RNA polymerase subunit alpha